MYLVINKCVTAVKVSNFSGHYLRNCSTLDIGVLDYISTVQHKEHSPEVWSIPPVIPLACTECDSSLLFSGASSIYILYGNTKMSHNTVRKKTTQNTIQCLISTLNLYLKYHLIKQYHKIYAMNKIYYVFLYWKYSSNVQKLFK